MKRKSFLAIACLVSFSTPTDCKDLLDGGGTAPEVNVFASSSCAHGSISASVDVTIKGETFRFGPSCGFSFDHKFRTKKGVKCEIHAGMCSGFWPSQRFEVSCADGTKGSSNIACPPKK
jgi:hypothetical protein